VWGDHLAGASELVRAQGAYLRDEADAAETWVRARTALDDLYYQRAEYRLQLRQAYDQYLQDKAATRRDQNAADQTAERTEAISLWQRAQRGFVSWPAALQRPEYAQSMSRIEAILRNWSPENPTGDAYRRALATEAGVLRAKVSTNQDISHHARVQAVRTLERLQRLAELTGLDSASAALAMR
jgi:hypothetical protein